MNRDWLVELRNNKKFTQEFVALQSGIQRAYYTQIEKGVRNPSVEIAKRIADCLSFDWTLFFEKVCSEMRQHSTA